MSVLSLASGVRLAERPHGPALNRAESPNRDLYPFPPPVNVIDKDCASREKPHSRRERPDGDRIS
jgi:hypothetical protein